MDSIIIISIFSTIFTTPTTSSATSSATISATKYCCDGSTATAVASSKPTNKEAH